MTAQLLLLSVLYILLQFPPMSLYAAYSVGLTPDVAVDYYVDSLFFSYWMMLFVPFACALSLPDLRITHTRPNAGRTAAAVVLSTR